MTSRLGLSLGGNNLIFPAKEGLVSDIPARDGKIGNLFLQCVTFMNQKKWMAFSLIASLQPQHNSAVIQPFGTLPFRTGFGIEFTVHLF